MMRKKENKKHDARVLLIQFRAAMNNPIVVLAERATTTTGGGGGGRPPRGSGASLLGRSGHLFFFFFFFSLSDKTFLCQKNSQKLLNPKLNPKDCKNPKLRRMVFSLFPQHERRKNFVFPLRCSVRAHTLRIEREREREIDRDI